MVNADTLIRSFLERAFYAVASVNVRSIELSEYPPDIARIPIEYLERRLKGTRRPEGPGSVDYLPSCAECPEKTDSVYRCPTAAVASRLGRAVPRARLEGQRKEKLDELALGPERCPPMKQPPRHPLGERAVAHCSRKQLWRIKATPINR
ncbi:hypothetical protein HPB47_026191 [Ixodes persulcatus]|uniref:Uncharacterized protein n=1 Tax=Ixodes persulcatus TaxID=34615 RepID=A0AC60Q029_IXOPE|nr:hypothetical protein HPB47_026191 [Ixodes persulcatus]